MSREILYDEKSLDLARHFLQDEHHVSADDEAALARVIQQAVEDWLDGYRAAR